MKHLNIIVEGQVQGVFFRQYTYQKAKELGIQGFVRNEPDSTVYIEAEGDNEALDQLIEWCKTGSPSAQVTNVSIKQDDMKDFKDFNISY